MSNEIQTQDQQQNLSALFCMRALFLQFRRNVNFNALITEELKNRFLADEITVLTELAEAQNLRPEVASSTEVFEAYSLFYKKGFSKREKYVIIF